MNKEALKLALEALVHLQPTALTSFYTIGNRDKAITALREALNASLAEQPAPATELREQKPAAWRLSNEAFDYQITSYDEEQANTYIKNGWDLIDLLYTTPPAAQRPWVGLTDEEIEKACVPLGAAMLSFTEVARAIEAKLKEKNYG
jgi:hypothetical protein